MGRSYLLYIVLIFFFSLLKLKAMAREIGPTRPKYMVAMIISFPQMFKNGVRFRVRPTVAVALTVSYKISNASACVTAESNIVETNIIVKDIQTTAVALLTTSFVIRLPKKFTSF